MDKYRIKVMRDKAGKVYAVTVKAEGDDAYLEMVGCAWPEAENGQAKAEAFIAWRKAVGKAREAGRHFHNLTAEPARDAQPGPTDGEAQGEKEAA